MRWMRTRALPPVAIVLALLMTDAAAACQCGQKLTPPEALKRSRFVLTGVVRAERPSIVTSKGLKWPISEEAPAVFPVTRIEVDVRRSLHGSAPSRLELTHVGCCVCEATLDVGHEYLLFVLDSSNVRDAYEVSFCLPNARIEEATQALKSLPGGVAYRSASNDSILHSARWQAHRLANAAARSYVKRMTGSPFIDDPVDSVRHSPWSPFTAMALLGLIIGVAAVLIRRRLHRRI